jgi:hypothetical protein
MRRLVSFVVGAAVLAGASYLLVDYVISAPRVRLGIVVIAGSILLVGWVVFAAWFWPLRKQD